MAGLGRPGPAPRAAMPAWKREILERKRAKLAALGGGAAPVAGAGATETAGPATEPLVLAESLGPLRENPFMRLESERRHGARRGGGAGVAGPGARPAEQLLELYCCVPGVRTIRADNILIIESAPGFPPAPAPNPGLGPGGTARIRAAEVLVYEAPPPPGRVSRLLQKFDPPAAPRRRGSPERVRPTPPPSPGPAVPRVGERAACFQSDPERCGSGLGPRPRRSDFLHKTSNNSFTVHPRGLRHSAGTCPLPNGPGAPESRAGAAKGFEDSAPGPGEWKPKVESGEAPAHQSPSPGTPSATPAAAPALPTLSPSSATPSQRQWVSAATSANDSFEIRPAPKPDMGRIPAGDLQARALASLRVNSRNSFVVIPKRKTSGAPPGEGRRSVAPPEEEGWASQHPEPEAQLVPGVNGVFAGERSPSRIEEGGSPAPTTALVDPAVRWQRPPSPPPSPRAAAEAEPAQGFQTPGLAKNGREPGRPGLPITFIDEVDSEDEVPQEAKLPCSRVGAPPQYHPHPTRPGHLSELQRRGGNTFTVVPKRKPGAVQANGEARPREAEEEEPGRVSEPSAAAGTSLKKRYPTVHEIEVIGGYLALQKSCLTKAGSSRKKASSRTSGAVPPKEEELRAAVEVLRGHGLHSVLEEWFVEVLQTDLQANISLEFWNAISQRENCADEPQCLLLLLDAFGLLESRLDPYLRSLELLEKWTRLGLLMGTGAQGLREKVHTTLRGVLFFSTPRAFQEMIQRLYGRFLRVYMQSKRKGEGGTDPELEGELDSRYARRRYYRLLQSPLCAGCGSDKQRCWCRQALEQFHRLSQVLHRLSLLERVSAEAVTSTLHQVTRERMEDRCRGEYERSFLREFHKWIERVVGWLGKVFLQDGPSRPASPEPGTTLRRWRCHVQRFFYRIYAGLRIEELFSIIRDFPDSRPAVEDLKYCLERTDQRPQLLVSLKAALETRLLHPGVNTCDIITLYISAIKALRVLDPSMVVLEVACEPIRRYLRTREDTVRQIVAGLTGDSDGTGDLAVELSKTDPASLETGQDSEDDSGEPEDWVPDPVDADPGKSSSKRRSSDIISLLVSIYGSKDLFINEYRSLLADRLLHQFSFSPEREIRNVELLKLRFGEAPMHFCEVMLKDMADSRRINANIREEDEKRPAEEQPPFGVYAVILSSEFWPPFKDEKLEVPEDIREALEVYCRKYEKLKAMRTLSWKHTLGLVTMDVELADRTLSVAVTPVQAVVLLYFQDQASWGLEELSEAVKMPAALLRRRLSVWLQQGVLREEPAGTFSVVEEERPQDRDNMVLVDSDDESDSGLASQADQKEEELLLFWTYIQAMLTNLESLSLERIYSMLRMFVVTGPALAEIDLQELQGFLQRKVRDQQLVYSAGVYRLPKSCG